MKKSLIRQTILIRKLKRTEIEKYVVHLHAHMSESGIDNIIYTPYSRSHRHDFEKLKEGITKRFSTSISKVNWERVFVAVENNKFVGHLDLRGAHIESSLHRCRLGMGLDREYRARGLGSKLISYAIDWIKKETTVEYIDLYTFSHNKPAILLYKKAGFKLIGSAVDMFRVDGKSICDYQMTKKIKSKS